MMIRSTTGRVLVLLVISASPLAADEFPTFTDPAKAGPDFRVQGEYVGRIGNKITIAAQVIALGGDKFDGILYSGGVPAGTAKPSSSSAARPKGGRPTSPGSSASD